MSYVKTWDGLAAALGLLGSVIAVFSLSLDMYGGAPGFGKSQILLFQISAGLIVAATIAKYAHRDRWKDMMQFLLISFQLLALAFVIYSYEIADTAFHTFVLGLVVAGFFGNHFLPPPLRPSFFLLLSFAAMFGILGPIGGLLMLGAGLGMIAICHLPVSAWIRGALLLAVAVYFALIRSDVGGPPALAVLMPILPSIFMFRLWIYLYDTAHGKGPSDWPSRLSYFFMLPNFVFPFFPIVDFAQWGRSYNSKPEFETYQTGLTWIFYGVIHLLLYRFVNYYLSMDPTAVDGFGSFLFYTAVNFALYLKISGLFHLILGLLHLFGFHLPETHSRYYLSFSIIEFWRRINIYWKDFMQKLVFNPVFAWVKTRGISHMQAVVIAITSVFVITWALHSYQWFWLRGGLFLSVPDTVFWAILCVLLIIQTVSEATPPDRNAVARIGPNVLLVIRTVAMMLVVIILWAMWSSPTWADWTSLLAAGGFSVLDPYQDLTLVSVLQSLAFVGFLFVIGAISVGYTFGLAPRGSHPPQRKIAQKKSDAMFAPSRVALVSCCAVLLLLTLPGLRTPFPREAQEFMVDMQRARLSFLDQERLERGYYENLTGLSLTNSELWNHEPQRPLDWEMLETTNIAHAVDDYRNYILHPSMTIEHRGTVLSTNRFGMRDKEYDLVKPEDTLRIAILGASRAMGTGVSMQKTFPSLVEEELNAAAERPIEVLNFSIAGHDGFQKQMILESFASEFNPDIVMFITHENDISADFRLARLSAKFPMPFPFMQNALEDAGVVEGMGRSEVIRRLQPASEELANQLFARFAAFTKGIEALPVVVYLPSVAQSGPARPELAMLRDAVAEADITFIDLEHVFAAHDHKSLQIAPWDDHPNARGHEIIANALLAEIRDSEVIKETAELRSQVSN